MRSTQACNHSLVQDMAGLFILSLCGVLKQWHMLQSRQHIQAVGTCSAPASHTRAAGKSGMARPTSILAAV